eukprot:1085163-Heterocapsa_arctica.AAC.1
MKQMVSKRIGLMTAGGVTRTSYYKPNHTIRQYDWMITDEKQAQSGDCQLLSSCALGKMGFQTMVGDWNQTRTRPAACMNCRHIELLEAAFPGGAFHPGLKVCSPIYREALRMTLSVKDLGHQLSNLGQTNAF